MKRIGNMKVLTKREFAKVEAKVSEVRKQEDNVIKQRTRMFGEEEEQ